MNSYGKAQLFEREAAADLAELGALQGKAHNDFGEIALDIGDTEIENNLVDLYGVDQLRGTDAGKFLDGDV